MTDEASLPNGANGDAAAPKPPRSMADVDKQHLLRYQTKEQPAFVPGVLSLPIDRFRPLKGNRVITLEDVIRSGLLANMREHGQLTPGLCTPDPERPDCWRIVAGNSRHFCADLLGIEFKFLAVEGDTSLPRMIAFSLADNLVRKSLSLLEVAEQIELFSRETGITKQDDLAAALKLNPPEVSRALALPKRLVPVLHDHVRNFVLPRTIAELISGMPTHELQQQAADYYLSFPTEPRNQRPKREVFKAYLGSLAPGAKKALAAKPVRVTCGAFTGVIRGDVAATIRTLHARLGDVIKRLDRNDIPVDSLAAMLPSILKG